MKILDEIIASLPLDSPVHNVCTCVFLTAVVSRHCGLASTLRDETTPHRPVTDAGSLTQKSALELAEYARSDNLLEAAIGIATINSLLDIDESQCVETNAYDILAQEGRGKKIAIVGHYPFIPRLQSVARKLWVIEKRPREGDFPAEEAANILPQADVVAISGTSLINHTLENLLNLCHNSFVVIVGPSCPLSPVLFNYGVDVLAGAKVVEAEAVIEGISQGATLRQVKGIKLLAMKR